MNEIEIRYKETTKQRKVTKTQFAEFCIGFFDFISKNFYKSKLQMNLYLINDGISMWSGEYWCGARTIIVDVEDKFSSCFLTFAHELAHLIQHQHYGRINLGHNEDFWKIYYNLLELSANYWYQSPLTKIRLKK